MLKKKFKKNILFFLKKYFEPQLLLHFQTQFVNTIDKD